MNSVHREVFYDVKKPVSNLIAINIYRIRYTKTLPTLDMKIFTTKRFIVETLQPHDDISYAVRGLFH